MSRVLVGRGRELERLDAAVRDAAEGRGRVVLITGEPGIGKSRLAEELCRLAERRGHRVVWGRCWEAGAAPPLWPWTQVLRALARGEAPDPGQGAADRFELFDEVARILTAAAERQSTAIVLEDLHAADRATLLLLGFVAGTLRGVPLLVIGTYRDAEAHLAAERGELLAQAARHGEVLALARLSRHDVKHLVIDALAVPDDHPLVDEVHRVTDGNPLFVDEVLRLFESRGASARLPAIPDGVRAAIRERLARVEPPTRAALDAAAVVGRDVELAVVAGVLDAATSDVAELLAAAVRAGLLGEIGPRHYRFSHVLVRDTVYDELAPARRAALHRRCGETLAALHAGDPAAPLADMAGHFAEAGPECTDAAVDHGVRAARAARAHFAFEEAVPLIERALQALDRGARPDPARRGMLLVELGEACIRAGDGDGGRDACRQAADIARAVDSSPLLARAALAFGLLFTFGRVDAELCALLEEALAALAGDDGDQARAARARLLARLAGALQPARDPGVPIARAREAIAVARQLGDEATLLEVLVGAGSALQDIADPAERMPLNRELFALAAARGERALMLRAHLRLCSDLLEAGDPAAADAEMRAYQRLVEPLRHPRHHILPALWWAMRALMKGRFEEHATHLAEAGRLGAHDPEAAGSLGCHLFLAARLRGELDEARRLAAGARWFLDGIPALVATTEALLLADGGDGAAARTALARVPADELAASVLTIARGLLAEAAARAGDRALAARLYDALLPFAHRLGAWGRTGMFCDGPVHRHLALLAAASDQWERAETHWAEATAIARADDMRPILVHLALEQAEALSRRGRAGDGERAAQLAAGARRDAEALGLPALAGRAAPVDSTPPGIELRLEGDVWSVSGAGESCRVRDSRGMRMLAQLVASPGREFHALELAGGRDGAIDLGDAGEILDPSARDAYRARVRELEHDADAGDPAARERARAELDFLAGELSRAVGLGGRERRRGSAGERARINAQRRLTDAIRRIERACPALGRHLDSTVRTGTFCWYDPGARKRP